MLERLDKVLVDQGLAQSRTQAQKLIEAGVVQANIHGQWQPLRKPAQKISSDTPLRAGEIAELRFVSRAGLKLDLALQYLDEQNRLAPISLPQFLGSASVLDVGQSTGGFTDCLLQRGVHNVVGVDVGRDQLATHLREHPSVICLEGINARDMPAEKLLAHSPGGFHLAVMDVSFISQSLIIPHLPPLLKNGGYLLSLVKPQFEVGAKNIARGGIVKDENLYGDVREKITECARLAGFDVMHYFASAIDGGDGNREFFMLCQKP
jgi:23S rRNA (cytidine1920-2'-O)/16S rRNA (cytidine1409-2'-O)-methyltransferase